MTTPRIVTAAIGLLLSLGAAAPLFIGSPSASTSTWLLTAALAALLPVAAARRRRWVALWLFVLLFVYVGVSAHLALRDLTSAPPQFGAQLLVLRDLGLAVGLAPRRIDAELTAAFAHAAGLAYACSLAALLAAVLIPERIRPERTEDDTELAARRLTAVGQLLVAIGGIGVAAALARFVTLDRGGGSIWNAAKSFWEGGAYLLVGAHLVLPGCACLLQAHLVRGDPWRRLVPALLGLLMLTVVLIPTGQRTFGLESGLVILVLFAVGGRIKMRTILATGAIGLVLLGVTQAARNEAREAGAVTVSGTASRLSPENWLDLYANQFASFAYIVDVVRYEDELDLPNSLASLLQKPVPRQLLPAKSQGFAEEFTARVYPSAASSQVSFATPAIAELRADLSVGWAVVVVFAVLAAGAALLELKIRRGPPAMRALLVIAMFWAMYAVIRGDLANGALLAANWLVPLGFAALVVSRPPRPQRLVVDALQVAPAFSGVGRMVLEIGAELRAAEPHPRVVVRCAADVEPLLRDAFSPSAEFHVPLPASRPRLRRLVYQQLLRPFFDDTGTVLLCPGDQAPLWGRAPVLLVCFDVRRLVDPAGTGRAERLLYKTLLPGALRRAQVVLTASAFSKAEIERVGALRGEVRVVAHHPRAVLGDDVPRRNRPALHFLSVGALRPYKGVEDMIRALAQIPESDRRPLRIVGSGEGRVGHLTEVAAICGVQDLVHFDGYVSETELEELYASAVAVISASSYEGYGLPVAESLAAGIPVIASDIPPHVEVAGDAAEIYRAGDVSALAAAMRRLATDPSRREVLVAAGRFRVEELSRREPSWRTAILDAFAERSQ